MLRNIFNCSTRDTSPRDLCIMTLRAGSEVNIQGPQGQTPLIMASKSGPNLSMIVDTLLNYEADPLITDNEGQNAIDYAADQETRDMLKVA